VNDFQTILSDLAGGRLHGEKQIPSGDDKQEKQGQEQRQGQPQVLRLRYDHPNDEDLSLGTRLRFAQDGGFLG